MKITTENFDIEYFPDSDRLIIKQTYGEQKYYPVRLESKDIDLLIAALIHGAKEIKKG